MRFIMTSLLDLIIRHSGGQARHDASAHQRNSGARSLFRDVGDKNVSMNFTSHAYVTSGEKPEISLVSAFHHCRRFVMGWISWIVFGLIAGILAKWIMPGRDPGGFIITTIIGIVGAMLGGWLATMFGLGDITGFDIKSFVIAVIGSLLLLFIYRRIRS
jgi:uncharacterized membrane protein YeaQ/YmgE (transglycosylase-associated protein family)